MISLYSGTPGSGKSLHMAKNIYHLLQKTDCLVIANFMIHREPFTDEQWSRFVYLSNLDIKPVKLIEIANDYWRSHKAKNYRDAEQKIRLFIDEAQILFNARDWNTAKTKQDKWPWFFSVHRHYGFQCVLCSQMDTNLDKQVRGVIEYNFIHRKISNIGLAGAFVNLVAGGGLFYSVMQWYPMHTKIDGSFFKYKKRYGELYDTHALFDLTQDREAIIDIGKGEPQRTDGAPDPEQTSALAATD